MAPTELLAIQRLIDGVGDAARRGSMSPDRGGELYEWILSHRPADCLELGFAHGLGTVYIAGALDRLGVGEVTSVDRELALDYAPTAASVVEEAGLSHRVELVHEPTSYNWFLHRKLREQTREGVCEPCYDFVFIDGAHSWEVDGFAFLMVDKLLRPGGWILFDDLRWTHDERYPDLPDDQRALAQVTEVFELLVATHPGYRELASDGDWGWARKAELGEPLVRTIRRRDIPGAVSDFKRILHRSRLGRKLSA